ncbi:bifunctional DNA-formamidopyrimidine glycosylase/DNA-(apurinic or apyrimidinic site) lyase [Canibacter zhoujuaniae]|uniref:bifunctional DNA-formamidopyrimidine glycosylase/DNA-(apurinic or apyrimidinic site) lyase n=1 Tax=Canibacter zhoujuaniae TaxID=2708343 RepID=UPI00141E4C44|nr:bifunctional DNA-formamidopyrimidine glycosylase/DNA-(apurinic or apyrimidinic site) lyase [Canibacter zhoujuaniae]
MPELPEVEVVRAGLMPAVTGATVLGAEVFDARSLKRHISRAERDSGAVAAGHGRTLDESTRRLRAADFERRITGARLLSPARRGKFLWIPIAPSGVPTAVPDEALFAHLAMSGQVLLRANDAPEDKHVRIRLWVQTAAGSEVRVDFADQRRFGSLAIDPLAPTHDGKAAGWGTKLPLLPAQAQHIARDLLDPAFDFNAVAEQLKTKSVQVKKLLLEQSLMSGIGNIYADEALWLARVHPETPANRISKRRLIELLEAARTVMEKALSEGGTSFDALYVNVNGESGYFSRSLNAYGRQGQPCQRCRSLLQRVVVGGRSAVFCPSCQRRR